MQYFKLSEFACPCCGEAEMNSNLLYKLDRLRGLMGIPLIINSGFRCVDHNKEVGGAAGSYHLKGMAADISTYNMTAGVKHRFISTIKDEEFNGIGIGRNFVHVDVRDKPAFWVY